MTPGSARPVCSPFMCMMITPPARTGGVIASPCRTRRTIVRGRRTGPVAGVDRPGAQPHAGGGGEAVQPRGVGPRAERRPQQGYGPRRRGSRRAGSARPPSCRWPSARSTWSWVWSPIRWPAGADRAHQAGVAPGPTSRSGRRSPHVLAAQHGEDAVDLRGGAAVVEGQPDLRTAALAVLDALLRLERGRDRSGARASQLCWAATRGMRTAGRRRRVGRGCPGVRRRGRRVAPAAQRRRRTAARQPSR